MRVLVKENKDDLAKNRTKIAENIHKELEKLKINK